MNTAPIAAPPKPPGNWLGWFDTTIGKLVLIVLLLLLLQIPLGMVAGLITERAERQTEVTSEIGSNWGPAQTLQGPQLIVPAIRTVTSQATGNVPSRSPVWLRIPASKLEVSAQLDTQERRRGMFHATVYTAAIDVGGAFKLPPLPDIPSVALDVAWNKAFLQLNATDLRSQPAESPAEVDGRPRQGIVLESPGLCGRYVTIPAGLTAPPAEGAPLPFHARLALRGTGSLTVMPAGRETAVRMASAFDTPGFTGPNPPLQYSTGAKGFQAEWQVVGASPVTEWQTDYSAQDACRTRATPGDGIGVELLQPVPTYLMVTRAAKYGMLFLALSFLTYFLFERLARVVIHVAQYGLLGLSVSLFALLLVALAEPLGFTAGYLLATMAVMAQASIYTLSVVGSWRLAGMFALVLGTLFAVLYVIISLENFALLVGSTGVFVALSILMAVTRRLDWGSSTRRTAA